MTLRALSMTSLLFLVACAPKQEENLKPAIPYSPEWVLGCGPSGKKPGLSFVDRLGHRSTIDPSTGVLEISSQDTTIDGTLFVDSDWALDTSETLHKIAPELELSLVSPDGRQGHLFGSSPTQGEYRLLLVGIGGAKGYCFAVPTIKINMN